MNNINRQIINAGLINFCQFIDLIAFLNPNFSIGRCILRYVNSVNTLIAMIAMSHSIIEWLNPIERMSTMIGMCHIYNGNARLPSNTNGLNLKINCPILLSRIVIDQMSTPTIKLKINVPPKYSKIFVVLAVINEIINNTIIKMVTTGNTNLS